MLLPDESHHNREKVPVQPGNRSTAKHGSGQGKDMKAVQMQSFVEEIDTQLKAEQWAWLDSCDFVELCWLGDWLLDLNCESINHHLLFVFWLYLLY